MMSATLKLLSIPMLFLLGACASLPTGPSVMVLPGSGKNFDQFHTDDFKCKHFALEQVGGTPPSQISTQNGIATALTTTAVGAATGAIMGGKNGAAVGAGAGLLFGTIIGSGAAQSSTYYMQQRYDNAYLQCMYANGHLVPMPGRMHMNTRQEFEEDSPRSPLAPASRPPGGTILPPPPGPPPPPPPGM